MTNIEYPWWYIKIISEISSAEDVSQLSVWFAKFQYVIAVAIGFEKKKGGRCKIVGKGIPSTEHRFYQRLHETVL
jgi:hypothetical protein